MTGLVPARHEEPRAAVAATISAATTTSPPMDIASAALAASHDVLSRLGVASGTGLATEEVVRRLARFGPNAVSSHRARPLVVLRHQVRSPLLWLLLLAASGSYLLGERSSAIIIGSIVALSVGLGFVNEFRAEKAAEALHSQIRHRALVRRDGEPVTVDVTALVPGDIVDLHLGDIVPADLRLLDVSGLECDESLLTGESLPAEKSTDAVLPGTVLADLVGTALMGTVVHAGSGRGVVVSTGSRTEFGKIAAGLETHQLDTSSSPVCASSRCSWSTSAGR
jgi:P-type Mg2+ transporter